MSEAFVPDTTRHVYRKKLWIRIACLVGGLGSLVFGGIILLQVRFFTTDPATIAVVAAVFVLDALLILAYGMRSGVVLEGRRIEVRGVLRKKSAELNEIEGYRTLRSSKEVRQRIYLKGGRGTMVVETDLDTDEYFRQWIGQITELGPRR